MERARNEKMSRTFKAIYDQLLRESRAWQHVPGDHLNSLHKTIRSHKSSHAEEERVQNSIQDVLRQVNLLSKDYQRLQTSLRDSELDIDSLQRRLEGLMQDRAQKRIKPKVAVSETGSAEQDNVWRTKYIALVSNYAKETEQLKSHHADEIEQLRSHHATMVQELTSNYGAEVQVILQDHMDEAQKVRWDHQKEFQQLQQDHQNELQMLGERHDAAVKESQTAQEAKTSALLSKFETDTRQMREDIESLAGTLLVREQFTAIPDARLNRKFSDLVEAVQNLARSQWNVSTQPENWTAKVIEQLPTNSRRLQRHVLQDMTWTILHEQIFCSPFRVLGDEGTKLEQNWSYDCGGG
jgi:chromosome segregation ATPase